MSTSSEQLSEIMTTPARDDPGNVFHQYYPRIARVIVRIVRDPARAEELAADVFWKFLHSVEAQRSPSGWLYRVAVRKALDELRRQRRWVKYERLLPSFRNAPSPEQLHGAAQNQQHVRNVLATMKRRDSELLILRSEGLSYSEISETLGLNETSMGTLLRRAQQAFRKEYLKRYGKPDLSD
jgi:RNA polymerase sigma-70 factor, ECF subfamily